MITQSEFMSCILDGIIWANRKYFDISDGFTILDDGVEAMVVQSIGKKLVAFGRKEDGHASVTFETSPKDMKKYAEIKSKPGRPRLSDRSKGRVDIVYYDRNSNAIGVVEVKRSYAAASAKKDFNRLHGLLRNQGLTSGGKIRHAAFAFCHIARDKIIENNITKRRIEFQELGFKFESKLDKYDKENGYSIVAYCALANVQD